MTYKESMTRMKRAVAVICLLAMCLLTVACGGPAAVEPPTYSQAQLEQLDTYRETLSKTRDRLTELPDLVAERNWTNVQNLIHGPLGSLRERVAYVTRTLLPAEQPLAQEAAKELFRRLEFVDLAADDRDVDQALKEYRKALAELDTFLELIPDLPEPAPD